MLSLIGIVQGSCALSLDTSPEQIHQRRFVMHCCHHLNFAHLASLRETGEI
jgi:hypothetical protein